MGKGIAIAGIWIGTGLAAAFGEVNSIVAFICAFLATGAVVSMPFAWKD